MEQATKISIVNPINVWGDGGKLCFENDDEKPEPMTKAEFNEYSKNGYCGEWNKNMVYRLYKLGPDSTALEITRKKRISKKTKSI